ncbi:hypothetical protein BK809_0006589 [Diplodia seriata]|uniref:Prion-inhibition and propagation HeLo domain-containing protein n=1 Tax=Diplodia seriata TaxID=420778 RepID=A0A1S8B474_9PEZI|nr:hypothetical protein BK809_0006589 [Diplodia seriata]
MPSECKSIQTGLMMEYERLRTWGEMAKLTTDGGYEGFDRSVKTHFGVILAVLSEIQTVLREIHERALRFPEAALPNQHASDKSRNDQAEDSWLKKYDDIINSPNQATEQEKHSRLVRRALRISHGIRDVSKDPRRIRWAVGTDKPKLEAGLKKLRTLTGYLYDTAEGQKLDIILQDIHEIRLTLLQLLPNGTAFESVQDDTGSATSESSTSASFFSDNSTLAASESRASVITSHRQRQTLFESLAAFSARFAQTNEDSWDGEESPLLLKSEQPSNLINMNGSGETELFANRAITVFNGERVWVEWRPYEAAHFPDPNGSNFSRFDAKPEVWKCVRRLAQLLHDDAKPAGFQVPHCRGFVQDRGESRFGFVYSLPHSSEHVGLKTLFDELSLKNRTTPSLDSRFAMARKLVATVFCLHAVKWLHKRLNSVNVLLFTERGEPDLTAPYISGFESSRPDEGVTMTMPSKEPDWTLMYCHPDYIEEKRRVFGKTFDLYSLGIILLEIAYWKPVSEIFEINRKLVVNRATVDRIRHSMLDEGSKQLAHVQAAMGKRYCDALRTCVGGLDGFSIKSDADEADPVIGAMVQQAYMRLVVDVLNDITL